MRTPGLREPGDLDDELQHGHRNAPPRPPTTQCDRCALYPQMQRGLCGACLGRELLGVGTREQHTAKIREAYDRALGRP